MDNSLIEKLKLAIKTVEERGKVYGHSNDGFTITGRVLASFFPEGITLKTQNDFSRFLLLNLVLIKLSRYINNFRKGGHQDSIHDLGIYAFLLEDYDDTNNRK